MNWRVATILNSAIAVVTLVAITVGRHSATPKRVIVRLQAAADSAKLNRNQLHYSADSLPDDLSHLQVESFGTVPPSEFYELLLRTTPEQFAALADKFNDLPINSQSGGALGMFFQAWAELDGKSALEGAFRIKDLTFRKTAVNVVVHSMSAAVAPEVAALLRDHPDKELSQMCQTEFMNAVLWRWADLDPPAAANFLDELKTPNETMAANARRNIAWAWGSIDPPAALAWIEKQASGDYSDNLFDSVVSGWSRSDPAAAMSYVAQHLDRPGATDAATSVALEMLDRDPQTAAAWLGQLPPGEPRMNAEDRLASVWADKDPAAAARWGQQLPIDDQRSALYTIARLWAERDWPEARTWISGLSGDSRDLAVAGAITDTNVPASESLPLAVSMINDEVRLRTVQGIVVNWAANDAPAAASWVRTSGLSRRDQEELLAMDIFTQASRP